MKRLDPPPLDTKIFNHLLAIIDNTFQSKSLSASRWIGVSRRRYYDWLNGNPPSEPWWNGWLLDSINELRLNVNADKARNIRRRLDDMPDTATISQARQKINVEEWLDELLIDGPLDREAIVLGAPFNVKAIDRAARTLGVTRVISGFGRNKISTWTRRKLDL